MNINDILPDPSKTRDLAQEVDNLNKQLKSALAPGVQLVEQLVKEQSKWNQELKRSTSELARLARAANWQKMVAESGRLGAAIRLIAKDVGNAINQTQKWGQALSSATAPAAQAFASTKSTVMEFTAAASPQAVQALAGWMKVLTAEIGTGFAPVIAGAVQWVRSATQWWKGLSDETRGLITKTALWSAGLLGVVTVLGRVGGAIGGVIKVAKSLMGTLGALKAHPIMALLAGGVAIGGALAAIGKIFGGESTGEMLSRQIRESQNRQSRIEQRGIDVDTINSLPDHVRELIKGGDNNKIKAEGKRLADLARQELRDAENDKQEKITGRKKVHFHIPFMPFDDPTKARSLPDTMRMFDMFGKNTPQRKFFDTIIKDMDLRVQRSKEKLSIFEMMQQGRFNKGGGENIFGGQGSVNFMALEEARKSAMKATLAMENEPWEKELLKKHTETNELLQWQQKFWEKNERRLGRGGSGE